MSSMEAGTQKFMPQPRRCRKSLQERRRQWCDAVEALRVADNLRVAAEAPLPQLVADHGDGMRALPLVFAGNEAAAEQEGNADGNEVIRLLL